MNVARDDAARRSHKNAPWWRRLGRRGWSLVAVALAVILCVPFLLRPAATSAEAPDAPDFALPVISGGHGKSTLSLRSLRGHPVLLNFFQSDCGPCLDEMPTLAHAARSYQKQGLVVVGVSSLGDSAAAARDLAQADRLPFSVVSDGHQDVAWRYSVGSTPTTMFIDAQGRVRGQWIGQLDRQRVRDGLAQAGAISCATCAPVERPLLSADSKSDGAGATLRATGVFQPPFKAAAPFTLRDQRGQMVSLSSLRGKVVALTFLSSVCTEQCPLVGKTLSQVHKLLGPDAARLAIVAVSIAPEQDSHKATYNFARESGWEGTDWYYLSGSHTALARVWKPYGIYVEAPPPIFKTSGQGLVHQAGLYLIDTRGRVRAYDDVPFLPSDVAASVRALLQQAS